ncbi:SPOR domain-containing protein [Colwellia ponticola]|uniref:DedD protein n=1 Tax=Colwellia ponticola TaxID=2304625 RepID=A0A8H2JMF9_9GAMM|nr:SPOR domain-containing protein [Colwellia ponticola]TMM46777.1 dedD protein [Colwellia ponticola]
MSTPFQNRLVGTIIVAAIVIIFLPDLLDGEKKSAKNDFEPIPQVDTFSGELTNKPFPEDKLVRKNIAPISNEKAIDDDIPSRSNANTSQGVVDNLAVKTPVIKDKVSQATVNTTTEPESKAVSKPSESLPEKAIAKEAWVIHLGSFRNKNNVDELVKKLNAKGYVTFTKPIKTKQGMLTKVIIGPELIKSSMVNKLPALHELTGIQGKVAYFEVNK